MIIQKYLWPCESIIMYMQPTTICATSETSQHAALYKRQNYQKQAIWMRLCVCVRDREKKREILQHKTSPSHPSMADSFSSANTSIWSYTISHTDTHLWLMFPYHGGGRKGECLLSPWTLQVRLPISHVWPLDLTVKVARKELSLGLRYLHGNSTTIKWNIH